MTKFQYRMSSEHLMYDDDDGRTVHLRAPFPALQVVYVIVVFAADDDYYWWWYLVGSLTVRKQKKS